MELGDRSGGTITSKPDHIEIDAKIQSFGRIIMYLKRKGYLLPIEIAAGIILSMLVVGSMLACIYG